MGTLNSLNLSYLWIIIFLGQFDPQDVCGNSLYSGLGTKCVMGRGCAVTLKHFCRTIHQIVIVQVIFPFPLAKFSLNFTNKVPVWI